MSLFVFGATRLIDGTGGLKELGTLCSKGSFVVGGCGGFESGFLDFPDLPVVGLLRSVLVGLSPYVSDFWSLSDASLCRLWVLGGVTEGPYLVRIGMVVSCCWLVAELCRIVY